MSTTPYADAASTYLKLGLWPIPVTGKHPPEKGTTGREGVVTPNLVKVWRKSRADRNVALRHNGTIAIDVDDYGTKHGADQLALLIDQHGALPPTYTSTARGDESASRQHLYRVPEGVELMSKPMPDIEICQRHHRYSVVWPSTHPETGKPYWWYDPKGRPCEPPHIDELPMLPAAWVDALSTEPRERAASGGPTVSAGKLERSLPKGKPCSHVKALIADVRRLERDEHVGHDQARDLIFRAYRLGLEGHSGARKGLKVAIAAAWAYLKTARPREAAAELDSLTSGGAERAQAIAVDERCTDIDEGSTFPLVGRPREVAKGLPSPAELHRAAQAEVSPFVDIAAILAGDLTPATPDAGGIRADGERMLYRGKVNGIVGEPEQGKTLAATAMVADELIKGGSALWVDADHNGAPATLSRLVMAGVEVAVLTNPSRFRLAVPDGRAALIEAIKAGVKSPPTIAVIDSVGEVMSMFGAKSNDDGDYTVVHRSVFTPLADAGTAVLVLDHLAKTALTTGYASGTGAKKRAMDGAYYGINAIEAFRPGVGGAAALKILKDRHGGVRAKTAGDTAAVFRLDSRGGAMSWEYWPGKSNEQRASEQAEADVAFILALETFPASRNALIEAVKAETGKGWRAERATVALRTARERLDSSFPIDPDNTTTTKESNPS